jgi:prepilin-type N-terminal cleavage/methylation domain-containing protein
MKTMQKGFTLVEIAIVLVIIGLLLGGILKGQEMITQAKIKNVMADMSGVSAAMYGYQDRYKALPGDDRNAGTATGRWGAATGSGNGDGIINNPYLSATAGHESLMFWDHLRRAGFISGTGAEQPFNAVAGRMGVQTGDGPAQGTAPAGVLGTPGTPPTVPITGLMLCSANLPDKIAISVADGRRHRHYRYGARPAAERGPQSGDHQRRRQRLHGRRREQLRGLPHALVIRGRSPNSERKAPSGAFFVAWRS